MIPMSVEPGGHYPAVVVGAGQAGLSVSWHLTRAGVRHVVLERTGIAHEWRDGRWDNFTLVTPNWHCRLPGYAYDGPDPDGFMTRDQVYAWVRGYADTFDAPVAEGVEVERIDRRADGVFVVTTTAGVVTADSVTSATGGYHRPITPEWAAQLPDTVVQTHSHHYRNARQLPGRVLVVGTGQSGTQIAEDLHLEGRRVHLAVGRAPRVARFYRGRDCMTWLADMGVYDLPVGAQAAAKRAATNHYVTGRDGGRDIDLRAFAAQGMGLHGRAIGIVDGGIAFDDSLAANLDHADAVAASIKRDIDAYIEREGIDAPREDPDRPVWQPPPGPTRLGLDEIDAVVWAIGFRADWSWLGDLDVLDVRRQPRQERGTTAVPGFFFVGLPWLHTWGSGRFHAIARDAEHVAERIALAATAVSATP